MTESDWPVDNCGLPDGVVHQHVGLCYSAGYRAGQRAAKPVVGDLLQHRTTGRQYVIGSDGGWLYRKTMTPAPTQSLEDVVQLAAVVAS